MKIKNGIIKTPHHYDYYSKFKQLIGCAPTLTQN